VVVVVVVVVAVMALVPSTNTAPLRPATIHDVRSLQSSRSVGYFTMERYPGWPRGINPRKRQAPCEVWRSTGGNCEDGVFWYMMTYDVATIGKRLHRGLLPPTTYLPTLRLPWRCKKHAIHTAQDYLHFLTWYVLPSRPLTASANPHFISSPQFKKRFSGFT